MKEREPIELTTKAVDSTLELRGNIFMPEPGGGEIPQDKDQEKPKTSEVKPGLKRKKLTPEQISEARSLLSSLIEPPKNASLAERRSYEMGIKAINEQFGILPMSGGSPDDPNSSPPPDESESKKEGQESPSAEATPTPEPNNEKRDDPLTKGIGGLSVDQVVAFGKRGPEERIIALKVIFQKAVDGEIDESELLNFHEQIKGTEEQQQYQAQEEAMNEPTGKLTPEGLIQMNFEKVLNGENTEKLYKDFMRLVRVGMNPYKVDDLPVGEDLIEAFNVINDELDKFKKGELQDPEVLKNSARRIMEEGKFVEFFNKTASGAYEKRSKDPYPESLDHLVTLIMASEGEQWEKRGEKQLKNEKGEIQMHNVMAWIREKIDDVTEFNPDSPVNLFGEIYIPTLYRQITIGEIIQQVRYFRKEVEKGVLDTNDEYKSLKDAMLYEVWFAMKNHSYDAEYRQVMGQEEEAVKTLIKNHYEGVFTKDKTRLYNMLTFASATAENGDEVKRAMSGEKRMSGGVGQAMRKMILSYYHIAEVGITDKDIEADPETGEKINMFEKVLEDGDELGAIKFYRAMLDKIIADKFKKNLSFKDEEGKDVNLVDWVNKQNSEITKHNIKHPDDKKERLNVITELINGRGGLNFNEIIKDQYSKDSIKTKRPDGMDQVVNINDLIRQSWDALEKSTSGSDIKLEKGDIKKLTELMMKKTFILKKDDIEGLNALNIYSAFGRRADFGALVKEGLKRVFQERENLSDGDIRYAHNRAFAMTYWSGISARNDTGAIGFDGSSKMMNDTEYRLRQMGKGASGDEENIFGMKRLMLTMWEGLRVTEDATGAEKSLLELLQGGRGNDVDTKGLIPEFEFSEGNAERQFAVNHLASALGLYQVIMQEHGFNFTKLFKRNNDNKLVINEEEVDKFRRNSWKFMRYGFDFGFFHYEAKERAWWREDVEIKDEKGKVVYGEFDDGKGHKVKAPLYRRELRFGTKQLQDLMFSEDITRMGMYRLEDDRKRRDGSYAFEDSFKDMQDEDGKVIKRTIINKEGKEEEVPVKALRHMSRNVLAYLVAKDIWKHRNPMSLAEDYSERDYETIKSFFLNYNMELSEDSKTGESIGRLPVFNEKDWETIAQVSRTTKRDLRRTRILYNAPEVGGGILIEMSKVFMGSLLKAS